MTREQINHIAAWARVELGMPRAEFNLLLPSEFNLIWKKWTASQQVAVHRHAQLCYVVSVSSGATLKNGQPIPVDFFHPDYVAKQKRRRPNLLDQFVNAFAGSNKIVDLRKKPHGKKQLHR